MNLKPVLVVALLSLAAPACAQDTLTVYRTTYAPTAQAIRLFGASKSRPTPAAYKVVIDVQPAFATPKSPFAGSIVIGQKDLPEFIRSITIARAKFSQWNKLAATGGVSNVYRELSDVPGIESDAGFCYNKFGDRAEMLVYNGDYPTVPNPEKPRKEDGVTLSFGTPEEMSVFIKLISPVQISRFLVSQAAIAKRGGGGVTPKTVR